MTIRSWPIPNGKILADQTMAALILGAEPEVHERLTGERGAS